MGDLNASLRRCVLILAWGAEHWRLDLLRLRRSRRRRRGLLHVRIRIGAEDKVTLAHVLAVVDPLDLRLLRLAKVVLLELACGDGLVVELRTAEVVMRLPVLDDAVPLGEELLAALLRQRVPILSLVEEFVVRVRGRAVVGHLLEAHLEVGHAHRTGVAHVGQLLQLELVGGEGLPRGGGVGEGRWPARLRKGEVGVARLLDALRVLRLLRVHGFGAERVGTARRVKILRGRLVLELCAQGRGAASR